MTDQIQSSEFSIKESYWDQRPTELLLKKNHKGSIYFLIWDISIEYYFPQAEVRLDHVQPLSRIH